MVAGAAPPPAPPELQQLGRSALYAASAEGGSALFLLADATAPPPSLPLGDTWSDSGAPSRPGWFVFTAAPVDSGNAGAVERNLRSGLVPAADVDAPPDATGFAWADPAGIVAAKVATALDGSGAPRVAEDVTLPTAPGMLALSFPMEAPLRSLVQHGALHAIGCGMPPHALPVPTHGPGASIRIAGDAAGCITFDAFVGQPPGEGANVVLMAVSVDPLRPFDPKRSYRRFAGATFAFARNGEEWQLVAQGGASG